METQIIDGFEIQEEIGSGSFSKVHVAFHIETSTYVAVKVINIAKITNSELFSLMRETSVFMQVSHPNIIRLIHMHVASDFLYFFLPLCPRTLLQVVNEKKKGLPEPKVREYFLQIFDGMRYLHSFPLVVHRDLKLENILLTTDNKVLIADFGLCTTSYCNTISGFAGSLGYTAPEVINGIEYKQNCDVWSLGVCLFTMASGYMPFTHTSDLKNLYEQVNNLFFPSSFSPALVNLLQKMLAFKPDQRPNLVELQNHPFLSGIAPLPQQIQPRPIMFYDVQTKEDLTKLHRKNTEIQDEFVERASNYGIDRDVLISSLRKGAINHDTCIYFLVQFPLHEKPELRVVPKIQKTTRKGSEIFKQIPIASVRNQHKAGSSVRLMQAEASRRRSLYERRGPSIQL